MHETPDHPEFMKTIKEIRDAEEQYDRVISDSKAKADKIMREAKERIMEERMKEEEEVVAYKNEKLKKGSKEIEAEVAKIVDKAKDEASKVSKKKADDGAVAKLVKSFVSGL